VANRRETRFKIESGKKVRLLGSQMRSYPKGRGPRGGQGSSGAKLLSKLVQIKRGGNTHYDHFGGKVERSKGRKKRSINRGGDGQPSKGYSRRDRHATSQTREDGAQKRKAG